MAKHSIYLAATPLKNACGRIDYISNEARQEHLVATYSSTDDPTYWTDLVAHCHKAAAEAGKDSCVEAKEHMGALANELADMEPAELAKKISDTYKELTGTENVVSLHWNKDMSNYHFHIVFSENKEINEIKEGAVLKRDTYFDAAGKRSTKKNCINPDTKELLPGCSLIKKGDSKKEIVRFGSKNEILKDKQFLRVAKIKIARLQNELLQEERFQRFNSDLYIAQQHIGKNTTAEQQLKIQKKNDLIRKYNAAVDENLQIMRHFRPEDKEKEVERLQYMREDIKKHALTPNWLKAVQFHLNAIRSRIQSIKAIMRKQLLEREKKKPHASLEAQIEHSEIVKNTKESKEKERRINHDKESR